MRRVLFAFLLCLACSMSAFAQSADQEIVSAVDSPDPVVPGNNVTYSVTVRNNGPDAAVNGGLNIVLSGSVTPVSVTPPAGFTCTALSQFMSCTAPAFSAGGTGVFTVVVNVPASLLNFADGSFTSTFSTSGVTPDPNSGNNQQNITTNYDSPQINMGLAVSDVPDPVTPNNDITYTVNITNAGPDGGTNAAFNTFNNGSLRFQSMVIPAGWTCGTVPSVGSAPTINCSKPTYAAGETATFTVVARADPAILGINDGSVQTFFGASATGNETNSGNNSETETTQYVTPDANMGVTATDSPDPVTPNGDITYSVNVTNGGPDTATNAALNIFNNGSLRFQSVTIPAGWSCPTPPSVGSAPSFTCTNPSFASGAASTFTLVVRADPAILGINDGTVSTNFNVSSSVSDPNNSNNSVTVDTAYVTPDANLGVTASDSPDPVTPGNNITYTGSVTNAGPDAATNTTLTIVLVASLRFQSISGPAGFTCGTPAAGANGTITCTNASFASGSSVPFTLIAQVDPALLSGPDGTISQNFVISSNNVADPVSGNNTATVVTTYQTPDADLSATNADAPDPVNPGGTITYTQTITNGGPDAATNVTFSQTLPPSVGFQSLNAPAGWTCGTLPAVGASGAINCTKPSLASGATDMFTLTVNVIASSGSVSDTVTAGSSTYDPDPLDNSAQAVTTITAAPTADLSINANTSATNAPIGSTFPYTITIMNNGPGAAANVVMTDILPASLLFRSITEPAGFTCTTPAVGANGTVTCNAASLANGASAVFTLLVEVAPGASGPITNSASVASSTTDPASGNSSGSAGAVIAGAAVADVTITKTSTTSSTTPGSNFSYTISVTNHGPSPATNVIVTDTLPSSLQFVSATPSQGSCNNANPLSCNLGALPVSGSATITLTVLVTGTSGTITNTANVSATEDATGGTATSSPIAIAAVPSELAGAPTLSEWGLILMGVMLAMAALMKMR